jgi:hypothetical protein
VTLLGRCVGFLAAALMVALPARASTCDDIVGEARGHESKGDGDVALRQYSAAISLDPTCSAAWLGLASLRARMGETTEAERVYTAALSRLPTLTAAMAGRARARWQLGHTDEAEQDMLHYADTSLGSESRGALAALEELASWYASVHRAPAQLGVWRRILALALFAGADAATLGRARAQVTALSLVVATADPVTHPPRVDLLRSVAARLGR